jgi:hypothetical protein
MTNVSGDRECGSRKRKREMTNVSGERDCLYGIKFG